MSESREKHVPVHMTITYLLCACGTKITITEAERDMTKYHRHDRLLDRFLNHKKARE